jgi:hypothetical protein
MRGVYHIFFLFAEHLRITKRRKKIVASAKGRKKIVRAKSKYAFKKNQISFAKKILHGKSKKRIF